MEMSPYMPPQRVREDKRELLKAQVPLEFVFKYKGAMSLSNPIPVGKWDNVNMLLHAKAQKHTCLHTAQCECMHAYTQTHTALKWVYVWLMNDWQTDMNTH